MWEKRRIMNAVFDSNDEIAMGSGRFNNVLMYRNGRNRRCDPEHLCGLGRIDNTSQNSSIGRRQVAYSAWWVNTASMHVVFPWCRNGRIVIFRLGMESIAHKTRGIFFFLRRVCVSSGKCVRLVNTFEC